MHARTHAHTPTPITGCEGLGHVTGLYAMHFALSGCPIAHGKTPEECKSRRIALNRLRQKSIPAEPQDTPPQAGPEDSARYLQQCHYCHCLFRHRGHS